MTKGQYIKPKLQRMSSGQELPIEVDEETYVIVYCEYNRYRVWVLYTDRHEDIKEYYPRSRWGVDEIIKDLFGEGL